MSENERKCKSRWKRAVRWVILLVVLYWISAPVTLWVWTKSGQKNDMTPNAWKDVPPDAWYTVYEPVLWVAENDSFSQIAIKPFEWLGVGNELDVALRWMLFDQHWSVPH